MVAPIVIGLHPAAIRSGRYTALRIISTATPLMLLVAVIAAGAPPHRVK
jgi:hypothetical protein